MVSGIVIAGLVFLAAAAGAIFKPGEWYATLNKPSWTPPNKAFPIVWIILYCMIAYSGLIIWQTGALIPIILWGVQLILNTLWSYFFFGLKKMKLAMFDVVLLLVFIIGYIIVSYPESQTASLLFVPYALWVSVAAMLNLSMIRLNPMDV